MSFEAWMKEVNKCLVKMCGMCADDLPDCCYRDWYDDGFKPKEAAVMAIEEAMQ